MTGVADKRRRAAGRRERSGAPAPAAARAAPPGATTYRVERPRRAGPLAVAVKVVLTLVFAATAVLCAYRAAVPRGHAARPHSGRHRDRRLRRHRLSWPRSSPWPGSAWVVRGARFADNLAFAVLWPIATVLMVIAAGASAVPQHYLRTGLVLAPAGLAAAAMMIAVAWVYNRAPRR